MLKNILNLQGAQLLNKKEQKSIQGGFSNGLCSHACHAVGTSCTINGRAGTCKEVPCDSSPTRLCVAPLGNINR